MTRGRERVHLDASQPGQPLRRALCGWLDVDTETDLSKVSCKICLTRSRSAARALAPRERPVSGDELGREVAAALRATATPTAPAPPRMTPALWAASCRGAEHRRCGDCDVCVWERDAERWAAVAPWNDARERPKRPESAPRWPSLASALVALAEFERHDRAAPSAMGGILDRVRRGEMGTTDSGRSDDPLLRRAGELVRVRQSLEAAYPVGAHEIPAEKCRALLLLRTPGVVPEMPGYDALAVLFAVTVGALQALVRTGRRHVSEDLAARGLIPPPRLRRLPYHPAHSAAHFLEAAE